MCDAFAKCVAHHFIHPVGEIDMPQLDAKVTDIFAGKVVRKDLVRKVKVGTNVPAFVLEYLLGKYCATDDPVAIDAGLQVVNSIITENVVRPDESNKIQSLIREKGKYTIIDKVKVRYLSQDDKYWAEFTNFGHKYVHVPESYIRKHDRLLLGGIWAQVELEHLYDENASGKNRSPFWIKELKPIQLASFDLDEYHECRRQFSTNEWIDLLLRSMGMEPSHFELILSFMATRSLLQ
jgi:ATP-dependent Lon protease